MFNQKKKEKKEEKIKPLKILGIFVFIMQSLSCIFLFLYPKRWQRFLNGEGKEIEELTTGKEDFGKFCRDSSNLIKGIFIPYEGNNHKPKVLRPKSLISYALIAIVIKLAVTGFLFVTYPTPAELAAIISSNMIALVNESRVEAGVEPLKENLILGTFAQSKGQDMITRDYFAHNTPEGKRPWQWIDRSEYDYVYAGENLAMDFSSAEVVHVAFMKSPTHRKNILNPKYKEVGMAVLKGEMNGHETILLVEFFGTQRKDLSTLASTKPIPAEPGIQQPTPVAPDTSIVVDEEIPVGIAGEETSSLVEEVIESASVGSAAEGVIVVVTDQKTSKALVDLVIEYSNIFFIAFLIFILISFALNIFVKVRVQHTSVILQSIVVIALLVAMILVKFHFVEQVAPHLLIL